MRITITNEALELAEEHCSETGISVRAWISNMIKTRVSEVRYREELELLDSTVDARVWLRPPFWTKKGGG